MIVKKLVKRLLIVAVVLALLVIGAIVAAIMSINSLAKRGIEAGGSFALGVPTTVQAVDIGLFSGQFGLSGLNVANPAGFAAPQFLGLDKAGVAVSLGSLNQDVVELPSLSLDGIKVNLERKGDGGNYQVILDNLKKATGGGSGAKPAEPAPSGGKEKKFVVRDLLITNVRVELSLLGAPGAVGEALNKATNVPVTVEKIELKNVGKTGEGVAGTGVTMGQLTSIIVQAVLSAAAEKGGGLFPADILTDINGRLTDLGGLKDIGMAVNGQVAEAAKKAEQAVKGAVDEGKKAIDDVKKGLEGLIPGGKPSGK